MSILLFATFLGTLVSLVTTSTVSYPSYPLAVKSPYLSAWLPGNQSSSVPTAQPEFWFGSDAPLAWNVMARITPSGQPAQTYTLFGFPETPNGAKVASQKGPIHLTATRTRVTLTAGIATFGLDFMTIIDGTNYTIHSLPYSYLAVTASASTPADIQIFSAIGDNWTGQAGATTITSGTYGTTEYFFFNNPSAITFHESKHEQAAWGSTVYATQPNQGSTVTSNFGGLKRLYTQFINTGNLGSPATSGPSGIKAGVAFSHSLSSVTSPVQVVFAVGSDRVQAINYNNTSQTGYYRAVFATIPAAVDFFLNYFNQALIAGKALDKKIIAMGKSVSQNYADILNACVRQTYGAYEITIPMTATLSTKAPNIFEKEISSDGDMNSVDSILPALPLLYLISPTFLQDLMRPVLDFVKGPAGQPPMWTEDYILHDIGKNYPNTTAYTTEIVKNCGPVNHPAPEYMPLEVTGSLMIMLAAFVQTLGNDSFLSNYLGANGKYLLTTYADYLANNAIYPSCQLATVDSIPAMANQTQLSITAAIGLGAMGKMTGMTNYTTASKKIAARLLNSSDLGAFTSGATPHFTYYYNQPATWSVMFPLFADSLLGLSLFQSAYAAQSQWYASKFAASGYGIPYSGGLPKNYNWAITDWNFWGAATSSAAVQNMVIDTTHKFMTDGLNDEPWGTKYNVSSPGPGYWLAHRARDTVGANWAIYLLNSL